MNDFGSAAADECGSRRKATVRGAEDLTRLPTPGRETRGAEAQMTIDFLACIQTNDIDDAGWMRAHVHHLV